MPVVCAVVEPGTEHLDDEEQRRADALPNHEDTVMKDTAWKVLSVGSAALAAMLVRRLVAALWPGERSTAINTADRSVSWQDGLRWALISGVAAATARLVGKRLATAGWERAFGESPPGVDTRPRRRR